MEEIILTLITLEKDDNAKLNLLTEIELTTSNAVTAAACIEIRNRLCDAEVSLQRSDLLHNLRTPEGDQGEEECHEEDYGALL